MRMIVSVHRAYEALREPGDQSRPLLTLFQWFHSRAFRRPVLLQDPVAVRLKRFSKRPGVHVTSRCVTKVTCPDAELDGPQ